MKFCGTHLASGQPCCISIGGNCVEISSQNLPADCRFEEDLFISQGWIDLQVNGFAGHDFNAAEPDTRSAQKIAAVLATEGVGQFYPTVITSSTEHMTRCLAAIASGCEADAATALAVGGIHLEGPWISPVDGARGAHPLEHVREPSWAEFQKFQAAAGGRIKLVTLAPEVPGALELISRLAKSGVVVSLGHTMADGEVIRAAVDAGAKMSTHLGNGAPAILPRHPNLIWDQLAEDRLGASVIFDGHHLPPSVMQVIARAKPADRLILVSDAAAPARCGAGVYETSIGGTVELNASGRLSLPGTPYLAGAALGIKEGIENAVSLAGCSLQQACAMASTNPAAIMGQAQNPQSLTIFRKRPSEHSLQVIAVMVAGNLVFLDGGGA